MANSLTERLTINRMFGTSTYMLYHVDSLVLPKQYENIPCDDNTGWSYTLQLCIHLKLQFFSDSDFHCLSETFSRKTSGTNVKSKHNIYTLTHFIVFGLLLQSSDLQSKTIWNTPAVEQLGLLAHCNKGNCGAFRQMC